MHSTKWILTQHGTWHCWPLRGRSTLCGRINLENLRATPTAAIELAPATDGKLCTTCAKKSGIVHRIGDAPDEATSAWIGVIGRYLKRRHINCADQRTLRALAERLAELGAPGTPGVALVFETIQPLLLQPRYSEHKDLAGRQHRTATLPHLKEAVAALPAQQQVLRKVVDALSAWERVTRRDPFMERFRPERVIATMLEIPDVGAYVEHLHARNVITLAATFHPNTLDRAKRDASLRGMFGGGNDYWQATMGQLNIIED